MSFAQTAKSAAPVLLGLALSMSALTSPVACQPRFSNAAAHAGDFSFIAAADETFPGEKLAGLKSFSVYALSRGSGVSEAASELILELRSRYQANGRQREVFAYAEDRIGLEGETRICLMFDSASATQTAWKDVQFLIGAKELIDLRAEGCADR